MSAYSNTLSNARYAGADYKCAVGESTSVSKVRCPLPLNRGHLSDRPSPTDPAIARMQWVLSGYFQRHAYMSDRSMAGRGQAPPCRFRADLKIVPQPHLARRSIITGHLTVGFLDFIQHALGRDSTLCFVQFSPTFSFDLELLSNLIEYASDLSEFVFGQKIDL